MESLYLRRRGLRPLVIGRGFTLVELVVVIAIITFLMVTVFTSQGSFNKTLILQNTAYDVALTLRNAQIYGLGSRAAGGIANAGYGIDFNRAATGAFTLFADISPPAGSPSGLCHTASVAGATAPNALPGNCVYDAGGGELVRTYTLGNGMTISDFCALSGGSWSCVHKNSGTLSTLDIVFARPNPDTFMSTDGVYRALTPVTAACIIISSPQGTSRFISILSSGEITANAVSCP